MLARAKTALRCMKKQGQKYLPDLSFASYVGRSPHVLSPEIYIGDVAHIGELGADHLPSVHELTVSLKVYFCSDSRRNSVAFNLFGS
jgi:hypothetical protein